jgi:L-malate glycosyltransferase
LAPRASSMTRHVLYIIDQLCEMGGAERVLVEMIRSLPKDEFRCSLVTFKIDESLPLLNDFPCPLHIFPLRRVYDWSGFRTARQLRDLIRREDVEIVHTFFETSDLWASVVAKFSGRVKLVSSRRDLGILRLPKHRIAYRVMRPIFDLVLTVSEQVRQFCLQEDRLSPERVITLYNGIDLEKLPLLSNASGVPALSGSEGGPIISTVSHIRKIKGIDVLIRAAGIVCRELPTARFLIVGKHSEPQTFTELQELARSLGLEQNVLFLGEQDNILPTLKKTDVFCLLSRSEGFSNALIEAMACSVPCVATRIGGNTEAIKEPQNGFLVDCGDVDGAAERILQLLSDPALARRIGEAGRKTVETKFTSQAMMGQLVGIYRGLLTNHV